RRRRPDAAPRHSQSAVRALVRRRDVARSRHPPRPARPSGAGRGGRLVPGPGAHAVATAPRRQEALPESPFPRLAPVRRRLDHGAASRRWSAARALACSSHHEALGPRTMSSPATRQAEILLGGVTGRKPAVPIDFDRLEAAAKKKLSREAFAYTAGGAGLESTMAANLRAFERVRIVPRVLRDVSQRDTSIELFGRRYPAPFLLAPVGVLGIVHPEGDLAVARAAAAEGIPFTFSNQASVAMERCA